MRILVTEMAGRASIELKGRELGVDLAGQGDAIGRVVDQVKVLEADGWSFEAADASFELLLRAQLPDAPPPLFELESYRTSVEHWGNGVVVSEATVKVHLVNADGTRERVISTGEGNGPVNALDNALRQALVSPVPAAGRGRRWPTTRSASSAGRAAPAPPPACSSTPPTACGSGPRSACTTTSSRPPGTRSSTRSTYAVLRHPATTD